ncbi:DUF4974 domain-containing protein [Chitinophaga silvatica]|uniref:DUF4974 domain-containing protein n=1 Tax=Chitinophaga silvatica TaxID=2282649 RepID=A0A3E1Y701_9BACT|nr:FecR domain-containing protein [Chitinophaga silvatica]RFS20687.1 DUF4974 domain-containing protein [Chitinophaga silvatica]
MRIKILFKKYLNNNCTQEELSELLHLLENEEQAKSLDPELSSLWNILPPQNNSWPVDWENMLTQIKRPKQTRIIRISKWAAGIAASLLLIAVITWQNNHSSNKPTLLSEKSDTLIKALKDNQFIYLPDGSSVVLNAGSSLRYDKRNFREVYLLGEAYFDVRQHANSPFLVHTGGLTTKVLGTSFNIHAYPNDHQIKVTVSSGKVQVSGVKQQTSTILTANEQVVFDRNAERFSKQVVDARKEITWRPAELVIDDQALPELMSFLEARFSCHIQLQSSNLQQQRVSATFKDTDSLEEILEVVCSVTGSKFSKENNIYIIKNQ